MGKSKKLLAATLAVTMLAGVSPIFAAETDPKTEFNMPIYVTKDYTVPKGAALVGTNTADGKTFDQTFDFAITPTGTDQGPAINNGTISVKTTDDIIAPTTAEAGNTTQTYTYEDIQSANLTEMILNANWTHAGDFEYSLTETPESATYVDTSKEGFTTTTNFSYNTNNVSYKLVVRVENADSTTTGETLVVTGVAITKIENGAPAGKVGEGEGATAKNMEFANTMTQTVKGDTNTPENSVFSVEKTVSGDLGNRQQEFNFTVNVPNVTFYKYGGEDGKTPVEVSGTTTLKHGEKIWAQEAPVGTAYTVQETNGNDYETSISYNGNAVGTTGTTNKTAEGFLTQGGNEIKYTNTKNKDDQEPFTGNIINNFPFLGMIAVALGGFIAFIAAKRRQAEEN